MAENSTNTPGRGYEPDKKRNNILIITVAVLVVALGVVGYLTYNKAEQVEAKDTELMFAYERLDSISDELGQKIVEIEKLGGDVTELTQAKQDLETEKENLLKSKTYSDNQIRDLRNRLEGYKELLVMKDTEIGQLKKVNEELVEENVELKTEKNQLTDSLRITKETREKLNQKVKVASRLEAENINVYAVSSGGKEREGEFRSRQIEQLKVEFNIAKNDVAPVEGKEIMIRVTDENGNVIFDVAKGSGTFMLDGQETFYTAKQEILFDNSQQKLTFVYDKGSEYERGTYKMEIFTDAYSMGSATFRVK